MRQNVKSCSQNHQQSLYLSLFFFNDTATTEIYTLSLHDALPIDHGQPQQRRLQRHDRFAHRSQQADRKSTRLNSSHGSNSYAVFCLKKKSKDIAEYSIMQPLILLLLVDSIKLIGTNASSTSSTVSNIFFF